MKNKRQQGSALIVFIIVLAIIAFWAAMHFKGYKSADNSVIKTGNRAMDQAKQENSTMQVEGTQNQEMLNSLDSSGTSGGNRAINQAKNSASDQSLNNNEY